MASKRAGRVAVSGSAAMALPVAAAGALEGPLKKKLDKAINPATAVIQRNFIRASPYVLFRDSRRKTKSFQALVAPMSFPFRRIKLRKCINLKKNPQLSSRFDDEQNGTFVGGNSNEVRNL